MSICVDDCNSSPKRANQQATGETAILTSSSLEHNSSNTSSHNNDSYMRLHVLQ